MARIEIRAVEDSNIIMSAMKTWRDAFVEIGVKVSGAMDVHCVSELGIWLKTGGWHLEDKQFYSALGLSDGTDGLHDPIVEINPARSGGPGNNRGLIGRDEQGVIWLLRSAEVRVGSTDLSLDLLGLRAETKVQATLPNGSKRLYYKVARLDATPREIVWQTKRFVGWCAQLRDRPLTSQNVVCPNPLSEVRFFRLNIKPQGIDKVLEVVPQNQIAIGWSRAGQLIDPDLGADEFASVIHDTYGEKVHAGKGAGEMRRFLREMKVGDAVMVPHLNGIYIGRVIGDPIYYPELIDHDTAFRRDVAWLNGGRAYEKACFPAPVVASINSRGTCISLEKHRQQIIEVILPDWQDLSAHLTADDANRSVTYTLTPIRPEQVRFRNQLLQLYGARCCLTETAIVAVLQAAHISPHHEGGPGVNNLANGLLLRSDIHELFDRKLLSIEPSSMTIHLAPVVARSPEYRHLQGKKVELHACPNRLADHFELARPLLHPFAA